MYFWGWSSDADFGMGNDQVTPGGVIPKMIPKIGVQLGTWGYPIAAWYQYLMISWKIPWKIPSFEMDDNDNDDDDDHDDDDDDDDDSGVAIWRNGNPHIPQPRTVH